MNVAEDRLKKIVKKKGYNVYRNGWPDFIIQKNGKVVAIEVKALQTEKLEEEQLAIMGLLSSLGIKCLRWSPDKGFDKFDASYTRTPIKPLRMPKKGSRQYCELVTRIYGGEPFTRKIKVGDRPYWQRCRWIYKNGKRKLEIIEHLGNRKPRVETIAKSILAKRNVLLAKIEDNLLHPIEQYNRL